MNMESDRVESCMLVCTGRVNYFSLKICLRRFMRFFSKVDSVFKLPEAATPVFSSHFLCPPAVTLWQLMSRPVVGSFSLGSFWLDGAPVPPWIRTVPALGAQAMQDSDNTVFPSPSEIRTPEVCWMSAYALYVHVCTLYINTGRGFHSPKTNFYPPSLRQKKLVSILEEF